MLPFPVFAKLELRDLEPLLITRLAYHTVSVLRYVSVWYGMSNDAILETTSCGVYFERSCKNFHAGGADVAAHVWSSQTAFHV